MPWIPILYPELDEHLIETSIILAPRFSDIDRARRALDSEWSLSDEDGLDLTGYLVEVDTQGKVKRHIRGDRMPNAKPLTKTDRHRMHIRTSYLGKLLFGSKGLYDGKQDQFLVDEICRTQEILDYIGKYRGIPRALELSNKLEAQKDSPKRKVIIRLLEASYYIIDDAVTEGKQKTEKKTKSKRTKNEPDKPTAKRIATEALKKAKGKASDKELVEAIIREANLDATSARAIIRAIFPPKPKPELTTKEQIERMKAKAEREIKKLEPYLEKMSQTSQTTVKRLIRENVEKDQPCIPGPQPTPTEKKEAKVEVEKKKEEPKPKPKEKPKAKAKPRTKKKAKAKPKPKAKASLTERLKQKAEAKIRGTKKSAKALPKMEGTPKQVSWANDIRAGRMKQVEDLEELVKAAPPTHPAKVNLAIIRKHYESDDRASQAWWWIDHDETTTNVKIMANALAKDRKACGDGKW